MDHFPGSSDGRLRQVARPVTTLDRSVAFYRDVLGLRLIRRFGDQLAFFDMGGVRLLLEANPAATTDSATLYFAVDDIHESARVLTERGVVFEGAPHMIFEDADGSFGAPGEQEWMVFFRDPDGHLSALSARIVS